MKVQNWILLIFFFLFIITNNGTSKIVTFRVFFNDKGPEKFVKGSELYNQTLSSLSARAIKRRLKVRNENNIITIEDAPIYQNYIDEILKYNVKLLLKLKWRNYCVFSCDSAEYQEISHKITDYDFVNFVQLTGKLIPVQQEIPSDYDNKRKFNKKDIFNITEYKRCGAFSYGESFAQVNLINADELHSLGITGDSVLLAILDAGFRWKTHNSMKNANVVGEYDFIQLDSITSNEKDDVTNQDAHGTLVFSTISGILNDKLIGISPTSMFVLCKTESIPEEVHLEEDNNAAAMERIEAMGADLSTSSLAYKQFNDSDEDYEYDIDLDGKSTITAQAINNAVARGMVCLTAAGNTGPAQKTLLTPGDADSAITCAAVNVINNTVIPASFTSCGPRADSVIKPDIAALGVHVVCAGTKDSIDLIKANGTSLSTPLIAGAASLLLSCFPELTPWEVRNFLFSTASNYPTKDNTLGFGVLNIWKAMKKAGTIISPPVIYTVRDYTRILFHIVPDSYIIDNPTLRIVINGNSREYKMYPTTREYQYATDISKSDIQGSVLKAKLTVNTMKSERHYPFDSSYFVFNKDSEIIPCGIDKNNLPKFDNNSTLFIYPSVIDGNTDIITINYEMKKYGSLSIRIYSTDGKIMYSYDIAEREPGLIMQEVDVSEFSSGTYFASVISGISHSTEKLLIIK